MSGRCQGDGMDGAELLPHGKQQSGDPAFVRSEGIGDGERALTGARTMLDKARADEIEAVVRAVPIRDFVMQREGDGAGVGVGDGAGEGSALQRDDVSRGSRGHGKSAVQREQLGAGRRFASALRAGRQEAAEEESAAEQRDNGADMVLWALV